MMTIPGLKPTERKSQTKPQLYVVSKPHHTGFGVLTGTPADSSSRPATIAYSTDSILPYLQESPCPRAGVNMGRKGVAPIPRIRGKAQVRFLPVPQRSHGGGPSTKTGAEFYLLSMMFHQPVGGWIGRQLKKGEMRDEQSGSPAACCGRTAT